MLVIGADFMSRITDPDDRATAAVFADGAGAVLLVATDEPSRIGPVVLGADGKGAENIVVGRTEALIRMRGHETFREAVAHLSESTLAAAEASEVALDEIDLFVYHQANGRILSAVGERLGLSPERVVDCIGEYGNTSAATLPLALAFSEHRGLLETGDRVLLGAFGAGFTWGAVVARWGISMSRRVMITGVGAVTPLGVGARALHDRLAGGRQSGIEDGLGACSDFDPTSVMSVKERAPQRPLRPARVAAAAEAVADAGWEADEPPYDPASAGCVIGSGIGGMSTFEGSCETLRTRGPERVSPLTIPLLMGNAATGLLSMRHGLRGPAFGVMSACASGAHAIGTAVRMISCRRCRCRGRRRRRGHPHAAGRGRLRGHGRDVGRGHLAPVRRPPRRICDG